MKNLKKKIVALGLALATMASSVMSVSASAGLLPEATPDSWPAYYVPYAGTCYASGSQVRVDGVKWSAAQLQQLQTEGNSLVPLSMELEFRTYYEAKPGEWKPARTHGIWGGKSGGLVTNIPNAKFEFQIALIDEEDVAIIIPNAKQNIVANQSYYAGQAMAQLDGISLDGIAYLFECELGNNYGVDSYPIRYSQRPSLIPFGITKPIRV